jgi:hypothetical protein
MTPTRSRLSPLAPSPFQGEEFPTRSLSLATPDQVGGRLSPFQGEEI